MSDFKAETGLVYSFGSLRLDLRRRELLRDGRPVALGGRALGVVETMVRSAGRLVTKEELFSQVWPDIAVEENALHVQISAVRRAFGDDRGLLKTEAGRGYRLLGAWVSAQALTDEIPSEAPNSTPRFRSNLPLPVSELIGRSAAIRQLNALISAYRIVTLSGPGGIGKTRLALHVVNGLRESFGGDTRLVELASISDPKLICSAVASALDLKLGLREIDLAAISTAIGDAKLLVLLDNCEHVAEFAATLVEAIIGACPRTSVLATSRELLRVDGEVGYQVAALDFPAEDSLRSDDLLQYSAVQLFLSRMQAAHEGSNANSENLRVVAAICRRLDGIPLAIEFAASRASTLGLDSVASRLEHRFDILTGGRRTALPRHQTLRATLDWSYELLAEEERRALRFASVFVGPFTMKAAIAVIGGEGWSATDVSVTVANLASKSLLALEASKQSARWRLLENTRAYGRLKLEENGEIHQAWSRHAKWHHDVLASELVLPPKRSRAERMAFYGEHLGNVVAALEWCFSPGGDARFGAEIANFAAPLFFSLTLFAECRRWADKAIEALAFEENGRLNVELHASLGSALTFTGDGARTREVLARGLMLAERLGNARLHMHVIYAIFVGLGVAADFRRALSMAQRGYAIAVAASDVEALRFAHAMLVNVYTLSGDQSAAETAYRSFPGWRLPSSQSGGEAFRRDHHLNLVTQTFHARNLWHLGYPDQAHRLARQMIRDSEEFGDTFTTCSCLMSAYSVFRWVGDWEGAKQNAEKMIPYSGKGALTELVAQGMSGQVMIAQGDVEAGISRLEDLLSIARASGRMYVWLIFKHSLGEALAAAGRNEEALIAIDEVIAFVEAGDGFYNAPETLRVRGQILASLQNPDRVGAEKYFVRSIELAKRQSDLSWELRTATSLARLWADQGKAEEAARLLGAVYSRFKEGFGTRDLRDAKSCLEALA